jgi:hypothetical protein
MKGVVMGFGTRAIDNDKVRDSLVEQAGLKLAGKFGKADDSVYLAALFVQQVRTNELLERLLERQTV